MAGVATICFHSSLDVNEGARVNLAIKHINSYQTITDTWTGQVYYSNATDENDGAAVCNHFSSLQQKVGIPKDVVSLRPTPPSYATAQGQCSFRTDQKPEDNSSFSLHDH